MRENRRDDLGLGYQVSPVWRIMPKVQHIINPDQIAGAFRTQIVRNAFVIGGKATLDLSTLSTME